MEINRDFLLQNLFAFAQGNHGVIIGKPGVGKSFSIRELKRVLLDKKILAFIIRIDATGSASDMAIEKELGVKGHWIDVLKKIQIVEGTKAVLFFDAFDAARDEKLRFDFLQQIKRSKDELSDKWNIIVSVRTFDATKSPELIKLFPSEVGGKSLVSCRNFEIPKLSADELNSTLEKDSKLRETYWACTEELREVLHTPYFLALLNKILVAESSSQGVSEIKAIKSETQLLDRYWRAKITDSEDYIFREKLLNSITNKLVNGRVLSILKEDSIFNLAGDELKSFKYLRSENILEEFSINNNRVGYSHNILFDYAVSRLCISDEIGALLEFIKRDTTRPFFFRPSFIYFFTHLWYQGRLTFWKIYWKLFDNPDREIQLSLKLILNTIIASEFSNLEDLNEVLAKAEKAKKHLVLKQLLQSIIFLREYSLEARDALLIHFLTKELSLDYLWELSYLLQKVTEQSTFEANQSGSSARRFFNFILEVRTLDGVNKYSLDRLGSKRGISLVCTTYGSDIDASRTLLEKVLRFLNEPDFDIWYFTSLTDKLHLIAEHDPLFVAKVYLTVFGHKETSDAQTSMGGTVALNLLSNRRQDFDMCYYRLIQYFPQFLATAPLTAIEVGLVIVNKFVVDDKFYGVTPKPQKFEIGEIECEFISDFSSIWHDNIGYNKPAEIGEEIIKYFDSLVNSENKDKLRGYLQVFFKDAKVAYFWKKLIELGVKHPEELKAFIFPLTLAKVILTEGDTIYEISNFINKASSLYDSGQLLEIETAIMNILKNEDSENMEYLERKVSRLLNSFPDGLLQTNKAKEFIKTHVEISNEPTYKSSWSSESKTTELWLKEEGIDVTSSLNSNLISQTKFLETFNETWLNGKPSRNDYSEYFKAANILLESIKSNPATIEKKVIYSALREVARTLTLVCKSIDSVNKEELDILGSGILYCLNFESEYDKGIMENASPASGYSPTPKIEAAEALPYLVKVDQTKTFINILIAAANGPHPIVRFNAIRQLLTIKSRNPQEYWEIIYNRLREEKDIFTAAAVLGNIRLSSNESEALLENALRIASQRKDLIVDRSSFTDNYIPLLLNYAAKKNKIAIEIIYENLEDLKFCKHLIYKIFNFLDPGLPYNNYVEKRGLNDFFFQLFNDILIRSGKSLKSLNGKDLPPDNPDVKSALELCDSAVQQIFFSLELKDGTNRRRNGPVDDSNRREFYFRLKPSLLVILETAQATTSEGLIIAHTAYYYSQIINSIVSYDPKESLSMATKIARYSYRTGYTFDSESIEQIVNLTEKILADHRGLLLEKESFDNLIELLDTYVKSGWTRALELLWKLNDIFR